MLTEFSKPNINRPDNIATHISLWAPAALPRWRSWGVATRLSLASMVAGREGAAGAAGKVKAMLDLFGGGETALAQTVGSEARSRQHSRRLGQQGHGVCDFLASDSGNSSPTQRAAPPHLHLCLGRTDLDVLISKRPMQDPGVTHALCEVVGMRKGELMELLVSMGQQVTKRQPTRLELLGAVVTMLSSWGRLSL